MFINDEVSPTHTNKICDAFWNYCFDHPTKIHEYLSIGISHNLDQTDINGRSMFFFRNATETEITESVMHLFGDGSINNVSCKFLVI